MSVLFPYPLEAVGPFTRLFSAAAIITAALCCYERKRYGTADPGKQRGVLPRPEGGNASV